MPAVMKRISVSILEGRWSDGLILLLLLLLSHHLPVQLFRTPQNLAHPRVPHQALLPDQAQLGKHLDLSLLDVELVGHYEEEGKRSHLSLVLGVVRFEFLEMRAFFAFLDVVAL